jgi:hypothetical protein
VSRARLPIRGDFGSRRIAHDSVAVVLKAAQAAFVTVGAGRGFVIETVHERLVLTTAQCLPHLSHRASGSDFRECTFFDLLGPLGGDVTVSTECLFVDPISDVAVLGEPKRLLDAEKDAYKALVESSRTVEIGVMTEPCGAWLLTVEGQWEPCRVRTLPSGRSLTVVGAAAGLVPGTSGSPILSAEGRALGIVSISDNGSGETTLERHGQPLLASVLPVWLFYDLTRHRPRAESGA